MKRIILLFATLFFVNVASCQNFSFPVEEFPEELRQDKHFEKASQGDIKALHDFAFACIYHKRPDLAMLCYKKASELGDAEASMKLAVNYGMGYGNSSENDSIFGATEPLEKDSVASYKYAQLALKQDKTGEGSSL
jgi:TPR repeat protein